MTLPFEVRQKLWRNVHPYPPLTDDVAADPQGWNSDHRFLTAAIQFHNPGIVVEVGVWKGAGTLTMAREIGPNGAVIAVDTWLGSAEHWLDQTFERHVQRGMLYRTFLGNVSAARMEDRIVPLPLDSASAATVLAALDIRPVIVHLDAGHDYLSVATDLRRWWPLLLPGGSMIVDDYEAELWPDVAQAVDEFRSAVVPVDFAAETLKCWMRKGA